MFQYANHTAEEQLDFASVLENLVLAASSDKDVVARLIASNKY